MLIFLGKQCNFKTCENTNVEALFKVCDPYFETIIVENLKTSLMSYDNAKLRVNDLISFHTYEE